ncbi:hypothetical protein KF840_14795 [bacterium]|nr:hypothetical protein [bacterium]
MRHSPRWVLGLVLMALRGAAPAVAEPTILFVTQPPFGGDFASANAVFGNHRAETTGTPRGGDLWIRYGDGSLRNLTAEAGYGLAARQEIAVREPCVHWSGGKALFAMVIGGTTQNNYAQVFWQIYEVSGLGAGETVRIVRLPQPANANNVSPIYGTDDRILFTSDRPHNGNALLYPQLDEYESTPTVTGLWSMNADGSDLRLLDHAVSGDFTPIVASDGRVIFTRWDHLQRDQQNSEGTLSYGAFNYASETSAQALASSAEIFPELRRQPAGGYWHGHTMNVFFPWQINEDGSGLETLNHVGRHELARYFDSAHDGLPAFSAPQNRRTADIVLQMREDPLRPGYFYATTAPEFATHAAGRIIGLDAPEDLNADDFQIDYVTSPLSNTIVADGQTPPADHPGHFRNPLPLSDGTLIAVRATSPYADRADNGPLSSRYDFHLVRLVSGTPDWTPGARLIPAGISKSVTYWDNQSYRQLSYSGPLWELDPVEVRARPRPPRHGTPLPAIESELLRGELGGDAAIARLRDFLVQRNLALIVSRNVTRRADRQQDFNLKIAGSATQTALPNATPIEIAFLQLLQGDLIRGYSQFHAGRRPLAQLLRDGLLPPLDAAPASSVRLAADGSVAALVPAGRALTWQLVGADGTPVVRERYWVTFAAGEMRVCTNCHGINRTDTVLGQPPPTNPPLALRELARWWQATYDGGAPTATPTGTPATPTPTATAATPAPLSGRVRYYRGDHPVAGVTIGGATSDATGAFSLIGAVGTTLSLAPARSGGLGGAISALDAAYALQAAAGLRTLDADQRRACDASGNGTVTALDAAHILQQVVGMVAHLPVAQRCGSDFAFVPVPAAAPNQQVTQPASSDAACQPGAVAFAPLAAPAVGQDFRAIAFGDCTGNWQPPVGALRAARGSGAVRIGPPAAARPRELRLPIAIADPGARAAEVVLGYDPARLRFIRLRLIGAPGGAMVRANAGQPGRLRIAAASAATLSTLRMVALFAARSGSASMADLGAAAAIVDEQPARVIVNRRRR